MAGSVSGQDEPNRALWLATRAGKMEPSCPLGTTRCIPQAKFYQKPYNKSFIDQVCSVKMAGCWPRSFFASLWTSTSSRSINTQKKNLANIQPSWPLAWSITHTYWTPLSKQGVCCICCITWLYRRGGALAYFIATGGLGISIPRATPGHLTHVFSKDGWIYREGRGLCQRLACPSGTRKTCRRF